MHDMIGGTGMLRGWAMIWQMYLLWMVPLVCGAVAIVTLVQSLVTALRSRLVAPQFVVRAWLYSTSSLIIPR